MTNTVAESIKNTLRLEELEVLKTKLDNFDFCGKIVGPIKDGIDELRTIVESLIVGSYKPMVKGGER